MPGLATWQDVAYTALESWSGDSGSASVICGATSFVCSCKSTCQALPLGPEYEAVNDEVGLKRLTLFQSLWLKFVVCRVCCCHAVFGIVWPEAEVF